MSKYIIQKSKPLSGTVEVSGSKNAILPVMAASLLADGCSTICSVPNLLDIENMHRLICRLGCSVTQNDDCLTICCDKLQSDVASYETVSKLRASFLVMGPLLARTGRVKISLPGGCQIGTRPVDLHLKGFAALGAKITQGHGFVEARCKKLKGEHIYLDFPSVGATENLMMAAALAQGQTIIENAANEPEIVNLSNFINQMGGSIIGAGTDTIKITGVDALNGQKHTVIPDRIEAGTLAFAVAATGGTAEIKNVIPDHMKPVLSKMREAGIHIEQSDNSITVDSGKKPKATDIKTLPHPGFPTDMQAPYSALMAVSDGTCLITETIFENRFMHVPELQRMGANAKVEGRTAVFEGVKKLTGAQVKATDLRAGAALVIAGLAAEGQTEIENIEHIQRGYDHLEDKLNALGANIELIE